MPVLQFCTLRRLPRVTSPSKLPNMALTSKSLAMVAIEATQNGMSRLTPALLLSMSASNSVSRRVAYQSIKLLERNMLDFIQDCLSLPPAQWLPCHSFLPLC